MRKKTLDQVKQEFVEAVGVEYEIISTEYMDTNAPIEILHIVCGFPFRASRNNFLRRGTRCPYCRNVERTKTNEQFELEVFELVGKEYRVLSEYQHSKAHVLMLHVVCDHEYQVKPNVFLQGRRCPLCSGSAKDAEFLVDLLRREGYSLLSDFIGNSDYVIFRHDECGCEYRNKPVEFYRGSRCPKCRASRGESRIEKFLSAKGIEYERQYRFEDCRMKKPLPFDFVVFDGDTIKCLIEFDGKQHYMKTRFGSPDKIQARDAVKNQYCLDKGLRLIRIPYWDLNKIETILEEELS